MINIKEYNQLSNIIDSTCDIPSESNTINGTCDIPSESITTINTGICNIPTDIITISKHEIDNIKQEVLKLEGLLLILKQNGDINKPEYEILDVIKNSILEKINSINFENQYTGLQYINTSCNNSIGMSDCPTIEYGKELN